jgi:hypothetical protein
VLFSVIEGVTLRVEVVVFNPTRGVEQPFCARPVEASKGVRQGVTRVFDVRVVDSFGFFVFILDPMVGSNGGRRVR